MDSWEDTEADDGEELRDFSYGGKDALVFLLDASPQMHVEQGDEKEIPFRMALQGIVAAVRNGVFRSPNDLVGVLLFGTQKKVDVRDFDHLSLLLPLATPEAESVLALEKLANSDQEFVDRFGGASDDFSLHEALWQCQSLFANVTGKVGKKAVHVLTCVSDPHLGDDQKRRQANQKASDLHDTGVYLDVLPVAPGGNFRMDKFYGDLIQLADDAHYEAADPAEKLGDLLKLVRKRVLKKRSVGKLHLDLGGDVRISVAAYNFVQKAYKPTKVKLAKDSNDEVKVQRSFINHTTGAPLLPSEINKFQEYGGKRIKFTIDEVKSLTMMDGVLGLKLCGFKPFSSMRWGDFVRSGNFLYPEETLIKGSRTLFAALLIKCLEKKVYAICSYKARDSSGPSLVALVPQAEEKKDGRQLRPGGFHLVFLPFADDLRNVPQVSLVEPEPEQVDAAKKMIKRLRLRDYYPEAFENPDLQSHYSLIEGLALQRDEVEVPEDTTVPDPEMQKSKLKGADVAFLEAVYPDGYDPDRDSSKRKPAAPKQEPAAKKPKRTRKPVDVDTLDVGSFVASKTVEKLKVAELKEYLISVGIVPTGMRKPALVDKVYEYFAK